MRIPPLPTIPRLRNGEVQIRDFTLLEMQEYAKSYGQQCRAAALEEVAVGLETGDVSGLKDDAFMLSYTTHLLVSFAKQIRCLK